MLAELWLSFLVGLAGSLHCVGMCGPIVLAYSSSNPKGNGEQRRPVFPHLAYNAGRVLSITLLGAIFGFVGGGIGRIQGVGEWFSLAAGVLLVVLGLSLLRLVPLFSFVAESTLGESSHNILVRLYRSLFASLVAGTRLEFRFIIGFLTPLLPCGLLYSMFVRAASSGSALEGAGVLFAFGMGAVPALMLTGLLGSSFGTRLRRWGDTVAAISILLMGVTLIVRAIMVSTHHH